MLLTLRPLEENEVAFLHKEYYCCLVKEIVLKSQCESFQVDSFRFYVNRMRDVGIDFFIRSFFKYDLKAHAKV